jgi:hypothetical protein
MSAFLITMLISALAAGPAAVDVRISPSEVHVGDRVTVEISVRAFGAAEIRIGEIPSSGDEIVEDDRLLSGPVLYQLKNAEEKQDLLGALVAHRTYNAIPFTVGGQTIPSVPVKIVMRDGSEIDLVSPPALLTVLSVAPGETGPTAVAALKGLLRYPPRLGQSLPWFWIIIALLLIAAGSAALIALNRRTPTTLRKLMRLSPAERALRELDALAASTLLADGRVKEFYTELSDITRRYLGMRFRLPALEMTTTELNAALREPLRIFDFSLPRLPELLQIADLVKFAKFTPPNSLGGDLIDAAREIVMITRDDLSQRTLGRAA